MAASLRTHFRKLLRKINCSKNCHLDLDLACPELCSSKCVQVQNQQYFSSSLLLQNVKKQRSKDRQMDPRKNVRYPYIKGDPIQDTMIANLKQGSSTNNIDLDLLKEKKVQRIITLNNVFKTSSGLIYEKITEGDFRLGRTLLDAKAHQPGSTSNNILLEGVRLIRDALFHGAEGQALYFTDVSILDQLPREHLDKLNLYKILYRDLKTWSDTSTPSGILGVFKRPEQGVITTSRDTTLPLTVIFDSLKDPGNVGTLIRTAAAVGCKQIVSIRGTVNLWDSKVLRAAMGGHFCIPLYWGFHWSDVHNHLRSDNTQVLLADTHAGRTLARAFDNQMDISELENIGDDTLDSDDSDVEESSEWKQTDKDRKEESAAYSFHKVPMSVFDYSQLDLASSPQTSDSEQGLPNVALVLGGETEGLSAQAKKFAFDHYGHYVTIPMCETVNSLNTGVAGSILMYEMRRQMMQLLKEKQNKT